MHRLYWKAVLRRAFIVALEYNFLRSAPFPRSVSASRKYAPIRSVPHTAPVEHRAISRFPKCACPHANCIRITARQRPRLTRGSSSANREACLPLRAKASKRILLRKIPRRAPLAGSMENTPGGSLRKEGEYYALRWDGVKKKAYDCA